MTERAPPTDDILASIRAAMTEPAEVAPIEPHESAEGAPELREVGAATAVAQAALAALPTLGGTQLTGTTLDALMRSLLEPMLKAWLDAHLPEIVEGVARAEIARLTGRGG